jgi:hypothetical protein
MDRGRLVAQSTLAALTAGGGDLEDIFLNLTANAEVTR